MQLKILSWNIWIDGHFKEITEFLRQADADIIGLQEVKDDDPGRDIIGFMSGLGYGHIFVPVRKGTAGKIKSDGPAIFSKFPIHESKIFNLSDIYNRAAIQTDIEVGKTILHVFCTHLLHTHQQWSEVQDMQADNLLKVLPKGKTIVIGDFNATPESTVIRKMKAVLVDTDSASLPSWSVYPEGCSTCKPQKIDMRLDYIFVSRDVKYNSFEVGNSKGSDHLPVSVIIEI